MNTNEFAMNSEFVNCVILIANLIVLACSLKLYTEFFKQIKK